MPIRLAILWHMHQPMYVEPASGDVLLPWVRLHATHAYTDMARVLERFPRVKATVNIVPSLVEQLEDASRRRRREQYLDASQKPPEAMSADERRFVLRHFFMASRERFIRPVPRYAELLDKRGEDLDDIAPGRFSDQELRDLQVLFNLAWMGFAAREIEPDVARLIHKGRDYDEADKQALFAAQQRIVAGVLPRWRRLAEAGQVELSATPYFHPILPLLIDSDAARRSRPDDALPPRFSRPDDAREQVRRALAMHEATFGSRPVGMWPAEGSVSPEALDLLASEGVKWVATDEAILQRSRPGPKQRGELYQPFAVVTPHGPVSIAFRDRTLSDRIGFSYSRMPAGEAVKDLLGQVARAHHEGRSAGLARPTLFVVLDGENAWEHYEGHGEAFLTALHTALEQHPEIETVTFSEALAHPTARIETLHSGSWINANYRVWIGHPEDNLAWSLLGEVRGMLARHEQSRDVPTDRLAEAHRLLLSAEGSDWFWWYGDEFDTDNAAEFDRLFRERLIRAASLLGETPPARLSSPLSARAATQGNRQSPHETPVALLSPRLDGRGGRLSDWWGAGRFAPQTAQGAMFQGEGLISRVDYGFSADTLFLRLHTREPMRGVGIRITARQVDRATTLDGRIEVDGRVTGLGLDGQADRTVDVGISLAALAVATEPFSLELALLAEGKTLERIPHRDAWLVTPPDADFSRKHWFA